MPTRPLGHTGPLNQTGPLDPVRFVQVENVRLQQENKELREENTHLRNILNGLLALQSASGKMNENTNVLRFLDRVLQLSLMSINSKNGSLLVVDDETDELVFVVVHGIVEESLSGHRIPAGQGIAGWVAQTGESVVLENARQDPRFSFEVDQTFDFHTSSLICVPIIYNEKVLGVVQALNKMGDEPFEQADVALLGVVAQMAAVAMHKAMLISETVDEAEG
jgi:sigma-B regulation protein RsbU (phosphoserine phosphatase)